MLTYNSSCELVQFNGKTIDNNILIEKYSGKKLPPTAYFFLVFNLISSKICELLIK